MSEELWLAVRWLHLIALAFFVGGRLLLAAVVVPAPMASHFDRWGDGDLPAKLALIGPVLV